EPTDPCSESFEEALRGWGRALPGLLVAQESPMLKGYDCLPGTRNTAWSHGMGALMASWLDDPLFAARRLGLSGGAAEALQDARRVRGLVALRRTLASAGFEFVMYVNPDADLDDRHADLYVKALGVALPVGDPPLWAGNPLLAHSPLDAHARLIGASIAAEAHAKLRESLGGDRVSRAAAAWMTEVFYSGGEQLTLDYRLARSIQGGYDLDLYLKTLGIGKP
ncbi:MAG TPA: hypothetical protein VFP98_10275, partial [Candidatus Polarisedimenticolia bacterium]|nr:hypothetical protein [Candidatus Polarisedimenticolia bacterium]